MLYKEGGWDSLAKRRYFQKMCFKCSNNLVADYISDIIPPRVGEITNYPLRNRQNLTNMYTRTEISRKSCIPLSVSYWNSPNKDIREIDTYLSFRNAFKIEFLCNANVPSYLMKDQRRLSVLHLKSDLFQNHLASVKNCSCGNINENALHYFFECENYSYSRIIMFRNTRKYHPLSLNIVLFEKSILSDDDNLLLFQAVQQYIKDTRRFE